MELLFPSFRKTKGDEKENNHNNKISYEKEIQYIMEQDRQQLQQLRLREGKLLKAIKILEYALQECVRMDDQDFARNLLRDLYPLKKEMMNIKIKIKNVEERLEVLIKKEHIKNNYTFTEDEEEEEIEEQLKKLFVEKRKD